MATGKAPATTADTDQMAPNQDRRTDKKDTNDKKMESVIPNSQRQTNSTKKIESPINTIKSDNNTNHLLSSQPRFSTSDIIKKFPYIKHRYCHKLKISIPWNDKDNIPTFETYYKAIHYFFKLVKGYDNQFQLLTWDIVNRKCNTISDPDCLPKTHNDLSAYLYNVHMTPSRVRASIVVTSSYNLGDLIRSQYKDDNVHLDLLQTFRKEKLWVQPTSIQTMGEIKLVGFLQFVHPKYTNLKKISIEIQAILETRDIVVEIYRPRALTEKGKIITAPEAITIGAPSDISIDIYKSLIEKWSDVLDGQYDMVIGKDSALKLGYFIPFANGILNRNDKNDAILSHDKYLKDYTCIKIKKCSSVDTRFQITPSEKAILDLH